MEALIITIIAGILVVNNIITIKTFIFAVIASIVWLYGGALLYFKFGFCKFYYHDILGWHTPDDSPQYSDGCSAHARCKHCGEDIMQDSQGNWFC